MQDFSDLHNDSHSDFVNHLENEIRKHGAMDKLGKKHRKSILRLSRDSIYTTMYSFLEPDGPGWQQSTNHRRDFDFLEIALAYHIDR